MTAKKPHMVMHPKLPATMWCKHCGGTFALSLPMNVTHVTGVLKGFVKLHQHCKPLEPQSTVVIPVKELVRL
jgi:hypothetical protein